MRYLFGDSTEFPYPFDFLRTLEAFMTAGTRVVLLEHRAKSAAEEAVAARRDRAKGLETLARYHETVLRSFDEPGVPQHTYATDYARRMAEHAVGLVAEQKRLVQEANERDDARARGERERSNDEVAKHLRAFFQAARLPTLETRLGATLVDGRYEVQASLFHPGGVCVSFALGTGETPAWNAPRRLGDLAGHLELLVGIKKSWIGNKISLEPARLDDWVIGSAELDGDDATIAVRKKPDQKDTLLFKLRRRDGAIAADVGHPGDPNAAQVPSAADAADLPHLERLWGALQAGLDETLDDRAAVTAIVLEGDDALERGLGQKLVERLVSVLAPTALEIARRSPNSRELSLKREGRDGRREELYLKRDQLIEAMQPLPREGRAVFAPLGLDDWVPAASLRPPVVAPAPLEAREELTSLDLEEV